MSHHPSDSLLGRQVSYPDAYSPALLQPLARSDSRQALGIDPVALPFKGIDVWTGYEVSWLDGAGKPHVAIAEFHVPCQSPFIIESKSFKLYLNSFNQTRFERQSDVLEALEKDLSAAAGRSVWVHLSGLSQATQRHIGQLPGDSLDHLPVEIEAYQPDPSLLQADSALIVNESLHSDLLKTNCPVTGQPDWASLLVSYTGPAINRESLLKYIISFRQHQDFHEQCVERIFIDILQRCQPHELTVYARYTRRGGLDINPMRTNAAEGAVGLDVRLVRQ